MGHWRQEDGEERFLGRFWDLLVPFEGKVTGEGR